MPANYELALQAAYVEHLKGNAAVTALVGQNIYDRAPQNGELWPHIEIGAMDAASAGFGCQDEAAIITTTMQIWSADTSRVEARRILAAVRSALTGWVPDLTADGLNCSDHNWRSSGDQIESDGKAVRILVTLTASIETLD